MPLSEKDFLKQLEMNQNIIHKVCHIYGQDEHERADLFQEITIKLWQGFGSYREDAAFSTWMYRVGINTAISIKRKQKKHSRVVPLPIHLDTPEEEEAISQEDIDLMYRAIDRLNPVDKALVLLYLEEKTYDEMAEIMGMTRSNVGVKLVRIRKQLEQLVNQLA